LKVALISLDQKWEDKAYNLQRCVELAARASAYSADLIIYPEMTLTGFTMNTQLMAEEPEQSHTLAAFAKIAKEHDISLVAGLAMRNGSKSTNTLVAFSSEGLEKTRYTKIHPFSFAGEDRFFQAGNSLAKMQLPEFTLGFSICYDLRFPELYSALGNDCDVLVNIANWPKRRVTHWRALLQARAIENQAYVIGVNRIGVDGNGLEYERSSLVVNANGEFIDPIVTEGEMDIYNMNHHDLLDFKRGFSTRPDRRPDLYRTLI
jgi:predicted amidohydrolase